MGRLPDRPMVRNGTFLFPLMDPEGYLAAVRQAACGDLIAHKRPQNGEVPLSAKDSRSGGAVRGASIRGCRYWSAK